MKYIVVTISDTSNLDAKKDLSGPEIVKFMGKENILLGQEIVSDDIDKIISVLDKWLEIDDLNLILTTGGTGIGPRDVTPEATKKIIDYEIPGIPELMREQETGFLVKKGDGQNLLEKISLLLNDKNKSVRFGRAGRNFVENNFNWKKIAKEFTKIVSRNL